VNFDKHNSKWKQIKLGDCLKLVNGRAYKQHELLSEGTPVLRIQNLNGGNNWYYSDLELPEKNYCNKGDLLFAWSATFGPYRWKGDKAIFHYHIWNVIPQNNIDVGFAYYLLLNISASVKDAAHGITMVHITKEKMENWLILLPPLPEQKRIAAILDKADSLRRKNQQAIQLADQFLRAVFLDMFGDPITNPKGWKVKPLSEITEFENGDRSSNYPSGDDIKNIGILFLNTKNIIDGKIAFKDTAFITREKFDSLGRGKLQKDDLVITLRGTLGSCAKFNCDYETGFINAQLMIIRAGERVDSDFLHALLTSVPIQKKLKSIGNGAAVPQLTASQLKLFEFYLPPLTEQLKFKDILNKCQKLGKLSNKAQSDELFNSLSQKAFAGGL
jgi:type I restriction enzyme S subunit